MLALYLFSIVLVNWFQSNINLNYIKIYVAHILLFNRKMNTSVHQIVFERRWNESVRYFSMNWFTFIFI